MLVVRLLPLLFVAGCSLASYPTAPVPAARQLSVLLVLDGGLATAAVRDTFKITANIIQNELHVRLHEPDFLYLPSGSRAEDWGAAFENLHSTINRLQQQKYDLIYVLLNTRGNFGPLLAANKQGYAETVGSVGLQKNNLAYGAASGNVIYDARVMLHEIGHLLGAEHSLTGLMVADSTLIRLATGFSKDSKREIQYSLEHRQPFRSPTITGRAPFRLDTGAALR